jgi:hypothetical protein
LVLRVIIVDLPNEILTIILVEVVEAIIICRHLLVNLPKKPTETDHFLQPTIHLRYYVFNLHSIPLLFSLQLLLPSFSDPLSHLSLRLPGYSECLHSLEPRLLLKVDGHVDHLLEHEVLVRGALLDRLLRLERSLVRGETLQRVERLKVGVLLVVVELFQWLGHVLQTGY